MTRGSGKFKTKRGGGRNFSRHLELDENGTAVAVDKWQAARDKGNNEDNSDEEEEEEEGSEEESEEETAAPSTSALPELSRAERKAAKKVVHGQKKKVGEDAEDDDSDDTDLVNPNRAPARSKKLSDLNSPEPLSRKEREAKEKQDAKERYWKAHLAGKTDQAKADLARLARIRKEREEAQIRRKAEADAKTAEIQAKAAAQGRKG